MLDDGSDEELADWCEAVGPSAEDMRPAYEYFLLCAAECADTDETVAAHHVAAAMARGISWSQVAEALGLSVDEARSRFPDVEADALEKAEELVASLARVVSVAPREVEVSFALRALAELAASEGLAAPLASAALVEAGRSSAPAVSVVEAESGAASVVEVAPGAASGAGFAG